MGAGANLWKGPPPRAALGRVAADPGIGEAEHPAPRVQQPKKVKRLLHLDDILVQIHKAKRVHRCGVRMHVNDKVERNPRVAAQSPHNLLDVVVLSVAP